MQIVSVISADIVAIGERINAILLFKYAEQITS